MKCYRYWLFALSFTLGCSLTFNAVGQAQAVTVETVPVVSKKLEKMLSLPGDLSAYQSVAIYPKISGFVESIPVDRGSWVKTGDSIAILSAPELQAQQLEAEAKVQRIESQRVEAEAKLAALQSSIASSQAAMASSQATYERLKAASQTPGVVSGNDLDIASRAIDVQRLNVEAQRAGLEAQRSSIDALRSEKAAAEAAVRVVKEMEGYLHVTAPFGGVITERNVHPGSLVGPNAGAANPPLVRLEELSRLRLTVGVPEDYVGAIGQGVKVSFTVPAYPSETFQGSIQRQAHSLDVKTRTMPVELDVNNPGSRLSPGMFASVNWPIARAGTSFFVPTSAIVTTTEKTFVIAVRDGTAQWVDVRRGIADGPLVEVFGNLKPGDLVVKRGTDELRAGTRIPVK
jgi:membrane fusion protein (multidrug efflux system)